MSIDSYTKVVLTAIALALIVIALNPWIHPSHARAQVMAQRTQWEDPIPVVIVDPPMLVPSWGFSPSLANKARVTRSGALLVQP